MREIVQYTRRALKQPALYRSIALMCFEVLSLFVFDVQKKT